jgi:hypothetical protein
MYIYKQFHYFYRFQVHLFNQSNMIIYTYLIILVHHDLQKPAKRGRRDTTKLIGEETVSFAFPSNFDTSKFKNIDNLLSSLEDWKLEYRKRTTGVCDPVII